MERDYKYLVIEEDRRYLFEEKVSEHLQHGFKLHGSPVIFCVIGDGNPVKYFQAMIYKKETEND